MCTYIVYHDPGAKQPLVVATTREDSPTRPTSQPFLWDKAEHFLPFVRSGKLPLNFGDVDDVSRYVDAGIVAQQDLVRGGTFMGTNKHGVMVAVNNRENNIPFEGRRSRGAIVLDALTFSSAKEAAETLYPILKETQGGDGRKYPGFNLIIADAQDAYVMTNGKRGDVNVPGHEDIGAFSVSLAKIPPKQVSFVCGYDINDLEKSTRTQKFLPVFEGSALPEAGKSESWGAWLSHIVHRAQEGHPFDYSIAQPNPASPETLGKGEPDWVTIGTNLLVGSSDGKGMAFDWLSMPGMPHDGRMQAVRVGKDGNEPVELFLHGENLRVQRAKTSELAR